MALVDYIRRAGGTARPRNSGLLPAPVKYWCAHWDIPSGADIIDWGCGKSNIFPILRRRHEWIGSGLRLDPVHRAESWPTRHRWRADLVFCTYVINVLPRDLAEETIVEAWQCVQPGGRLVISWRDDLPEGVDTTHDMKTRSCQRYITDTEIEDLVDLLEPVYWDVVGASGRFKILTLRKESD